jgi:hypothetical protein
MGKVKEYLWIALVLTIAVVLFVSIAISNGVTTFIGVLQVVGLMILILVAAALLIYLFLTKISFKKASEKEMKAEDDILLQATAFSQAALWIYLSLIPSDDNIVALKWLVPSAAILFYCLRAIGKLKDNGKYRFYSIIVLFFVISLSVQVLILTVQSPFWEGLIVIDGVDLTYVILARGITIAPAVAAIFFSAKIKTRYMG